VLVGAIEVHFYRQDWMLHRSDEPYLGIVQRHALAITDPPAAAGDFALYHFGRCWSHGAIVLEWPLIIHAVVQHGVILSDGEKEGMLVRRKRRCFRLQDPPATAGGTESGEHRTCGRPRPGVFFGCE